MKISTEHRDALNEALDETAGYEGDVYVFNVKHIETLRSAVIAMLELEAQIAAVAPAVDAQPVAEVVKWQTFTGHTAWDLKVFDKTLEHGAKLYASAQSEGLRKDAERYRWLRDWYLRGGLRAEIHPVGHIVQTTPAIVDAAIDAALSQQDPQ